MNNLRHTQGLQHALQIQPIHQDPTHPADQQYRLTIFFEKSDLVATNVVGMESPVVLLVTEYCMSEFGRQWIKFFRCKYPEPKAQKAQ